MTAAVTLPVEQLSADREHLSPFIEALFRHCPPGGYVSLRSFRDDRAGPAVVEPVPFTGLDALVAAAEREATRVANLRLPMVFAPPLALFKGPDKADMATLMAGPVLSVDMDTGDPTAALERLQAVLGPATLVVASGGVLKDPGTGTVRPKLHAHWRLSRPTTDTAGHATLREARRLAARLIGADPTAASPVHPIRWPGSWHRKAAPRLCRIVGGDPAADIRLSEAHAALAEVAGERSEYRSSTVPRLPIGDRRLMAPDPADAVAALQALPNDTDRDTWIARCAAFKAAVGGSEEFLPDLVEWCLQWPDNTPEYVRYHCWDSITDSAAGWPALCRWARDHGFNDAEIDFRTDPLEDLIESRIVRATGPEHHQSSGFDATPFVLRDPASIPPRDWLYGRHLIRRFVSVTVAPGAVGKSSLTIAEALAMATGRNVLGHTLSGEPLRCWLWNLEDPRDEIERRIAGACLHFGLSAADLGGRLFVDSGRDHPLCIGTTDRHGTRIHEPVVDALVEALRRRRIDVLVVDPFVSSHGVPENDNTAIDAIAKAWGRVAERADCAIELIHHARKMAGAEVTAESSRGGIALISASRVTRVLNRMSEGDAARAGVDEPRRYFRAFSDKANLSPPAEASDWYHLESVSLPNGDSVGVVTPWTWPDAFDGVTAQDLLAVQRRIGGGEWREDFRAAAWAGKAVADALDLDIENKAAKVKIKALLKTWIAGGALRVVDRTDEHRSTRKFVEVGTWAET